MSNLAGLHDIESVAIAPPDTWLLDTIALADNPPPRDYGRVAPGLHSIVRANWGYGSTGTLPSLSQYEEYLRRLVAYVRGSQGCRRWIIGNEPNLPREWPDNQPIFPWHYANCYQKARAAIHAIAGHETDEVLVAGSGPWNAELKYPGNASGDWVGYFVDVIAALGNGVDGFALHAYTHGYNPALVTSTARMAPPFQHRHYEFRAYRDFLDAIPPALHQKPIYITEANGDGPWQATGLMPAMLEEIDAWNKNNRPKIGAVIFYRYPRYDQYAIEGKADVIAEYKAAVGHGYIAPVWAESLPPTTNPALSTPPAASALPPRQWDMRLFGRGVTIETPPVAPGQLFWRVVKAEWLDESQAGGRHHILVDTLERDGTRAVDVPLKVTWPSGEHYVISQAKPGEPWSANYPMSPSRNEFAITVVADAPAERVKGIGMGADTPGGFNAGIHTSTAIVFQLTTMPATVTPPPVVGEGPTPAPAPEPTPQPQPTPAPAPSGIIDPMVADAILRVESGGRTHGADGRVIIRFEAHVFKAQLGNDDLWGKHFSTDKQKPWENQLFRSHVDTPWWPIHTGKQDDEYGALKFARSLHVEAANRSISMGAPQIMGFNHARIGYRSATVMLEAFQGAAMQALGFLNFCLSDPALFAAIQRKDWREIARRYNGAGQVDHYAALLAKAYADRVNRNS
jgi:hypothetical protein